MLQEIFLSLAGHPSSALKAAASAADGSLPTSPPERELLGAVVHLSDLHGGLRAAATRISSSRSSAICKAVTTAILAEDLASFRQAVLEAEKRIMREDPSLVGAYNIVPLTAVVAELSVWTSRLEWLRGLVEFMLESHQPEHGRDHDCTGAMLVERLRLDLQTGYADLEMSANRLLVVAERAWLRQASAWLFYGGLSSRQDGDDFFVRHSDVGGYTIDWQLVPPFVAPATALSILSTGKLFNYVQRKELNVSGGHASIRQILPHLDELAGLTYPLTSTALSAAIVKIRRALSRATLQAILPPTRVLEVLQLLRDFFLLGHGEFATYLVRQADESMSNRWRRADSLANQKRSTLAPGVVKHGEAAAVLAHTWPSLGSAYGKNADQDDRLELARSNLRLTHADPPLRTEVAPADSYGPDTPASSRLSSAIPFTSLLLSAPFLLSLDIPTPLDLFLSESDMQTYGIIHSFLLSIRRAHIHLSGLWTATSLRRHHPAPPSPPFTQVYGGKEQVQILRSRYTSRADAMRRTWATSSAALFLLAETENYFQSEIVTKLWDGFHAWIGATHDSAQPLRSSSPSEQASQKERFRNGAAASEASRLAQPLQALHLSDDQSSQSGHTPDPETLAAAHRVYLRSLTRRLLLTEKPFIDAFYELLIHIDQVVALVNRLHSVWKATDLEADAGVVDALVDLEQEERDIGKDLTRAEASVRRAVQRILDVLRELESNRMMSAGNSVQAEDLDDTALLQGGVGISGTGDYVAANVGGVDRLLVKLDFGTWFDYEPEK